MSTSDQKLLNDLENKNLYRLNSSRATRENKEGKNYFVLNAYITSASNTEEAKQRLRKLGLGDKTIQKEYKFPIPENLSVIEFNKLYDSVRANIRSLLEKGKLEEYEQTPMTQGMKRNDTHHRTKPLSNSDKTMDARNHLEFPSSFYGKEVPDFRQYKTLLHKTRDQIKTKLLEPSSVPLSRPRTVGGKAKSK